MCAGFMTFAHDCRDPPVQIVREESATDSCRVDYGRASGASGDVSCLVDRRALSGRPPPCVPNSSRIVIVMPYAADIVETVEPQRGGHGPGDCERLDRTARRSRHGCGGLDSPELPRGVQRLPRRTWPEAASRVTQDTRLALSRSADRRLAGSRCPPPAPDFHRLPGADARTVTPQAQTRLCW